MGIVTEARFVRVMERLANDLGMKFNGNYFETDMESPTWSAFSFLERIERAQKTADKTEKKLNALMHYLELERVTHNEKTVIVIQPIKKLRSKKNVKK